MKENSNSNNKLVRICNIIKVSCFFVLYFVLGVLNTAISYAQDYIPIRDNEKVISREPGKMVTKYGVGRPMYLDLETVEEIKIKDKIDLTSDRRRVAMYGVAPGGRRGRRYNIIPKEPIKEIEDIQPEEDKIEDFDENVKEDPKVNGPKNEEVISADGVVPPAEEQENSDLEKEKMK